MNNRNENQSSQNRTPNQNQGNFKNDPQRASEAGRKGGQASHGSDSSRDKR